MTIVLCEMPRDAADAILAGERPGGVRIAEDYRRSSPRARRSASAPSGSWTLTSSEPPAIPSVELATPASRGLVFRPHHRGFGPVDPLGPDTLAPPLLDFLGRAVAACCTLSVLRRQQHGQDDDSRALVGVRRSRSVHAAARAASRRIHDRHDTADSRGDVQPPRQFPLWTELVESCAPEPGIAPSPRPSREALPAGRVLADAGAVAGTLRECLGRRYGRSDSERGWRRQISGSRLLRRLHGWPWSTSITS